MNKSTDVFVLTDTDREWLDKQLKKAFKPRKTGKTYWFYKGYLVTIRNRDNKVIKKEKM